VQKCQGAEGSQRRALSQHATSRGTPHRSCSNYTGAENEAASGAETVRINIMRMPERIQANQFDIFIDTNIRKKSQTAPRLEDGLAQGRIVMADIVIIGAGLSGAIMAYEMKDQMRREDRLTVVTKDPIYHFVPSNPWVPVGWRTRENLEVDLAPTMARKGIGFKASAVTKVEPKENRIELADGSSSNTIISSSPPALNSPSTRSNASARRVKRSRSAT